MWVVLSQVGCLWIICVGCTKSSWLSLDNLCGLFLVELVVSG